MKATFRFALAAAALLGASAAAAAGNPLDPGFYQGHPTVQATPASTDEKPYVDSHNPLYPTFGLSEARFEGTAKTTGEAYHDSNNPLYPGFVRK